MKIVKPITITEDLLISSNVSENDYDVYSPSSTYSSGDRVIVTTGYHKVYESLVSSNTGNFPPDNTGGESAKWIEVGSTNRWKLFDEYVNTQTIRNGSIEIELKPGRINSIGLLNVSAKSVKITMTTDVEGIVYSKEKSLLIFNSTNFYEYFFNPTPNKTTVVFDDLPLYGEATVKIEIDNGTKDAACGLCVLGFFYSIGISLFGASPNIIDFSTKTTDVFGNTKWTKRNNAKKLDIDLFVPDNMIDETNRLLSEYTAEPLLWIGSENYASLIVYGAFTDYTEVLSTPAGGEVSITIEGLI